MTSTPVMQSAGNVAVPLAPEAAPALEVIGLRRSFRATRRSPERRALAGVDLVVFAGQWTAVLGPNGSGKSTLVRILAGSDAAQEGTIRIFGCEVGAGASPRVRRMAASRMGIVFQKPGLDNLLTVRENLAAQGSLYGLSAGRLKDRIETLARQFGLTDRLDDRVASLSGGYQRRVDLARALLHDPDLLILDEATSGLDHESRSGFLDLISSLRSARHAAHPLTVIMTTHLMDEAERAERVVMMAEGAIVADGSPAELRAACGGRVLRVWSASESETGRLALALSQAGFKPERGENGTLIARSEQGPGAEPDIEAAVATLARLGASFQVAPPDLGDAFLAMAGRPLGDSAPGGPR